MKKLELVNFSTIAILNLGKDKGLRELAELKKGVKNEPGVFKDYLRVHKKPCYNEYYRYDE